ncbi:hypothetical protein SUGI_0714900 [Cryptomeria japonica]|nr:hypothetical protein SUGI_0714900 [Cryptomeria japonica]
MEEWIQVVLYLGTGSGLDEERQVVRSLTGPPGIELVVKHARASHHDDAVFGMDLVGGVPAVGEKLNSLRIIPVVGGVRARNKVAHICASVVPPTRLNECPVGCECT